MGDLEDIKRLLERIADSLEEIAKAIKAKDKERKFIKGTEEEKSESTETIDFVNDFSEIEEFLNSKGIRIKTIKEEEEYDEVLDRIALFMGNRFSQIKDLYKLIKRNLNTGRSFKMDLKRKRQDEISSITQLCNDFYEIAFLEEYKYFKSPQYILYARVNRIPKAIRFFSGGWLERYVKASIVEAIKSISHPLPVNYSYLKNPQIELPNGDDFELDVMFKIEDEIFWFEAKTGDYQRYINKYSKIANILGLDCEHAFMILTDITDEGAKALKSLFNMTVVRIDNFFETFKEHIKHLKPSSQEKEGESFEEFE